MRSFRVSVVSFSFDVDIYGKGAGMFVVAFASSICPVSLIKNNSELATNIVDVVLCWSMTGKIYKSSTHILYTKVFRLASRYLCKLDDP